MEMLALPEMPEKVKTVFATYPQQALTKLLALRRLIFEEAARQEVGALQETLKWGEPAYLTPKTKAGSTIRMAWKPKAERSVSLYFNCNTDLVGRMSDAFPVEFKYIGNREVAMPLDGELQEFAARAIVSMALTYHRDK